MIVFFTPDPRRPRDTVCLKRPGKARHTSDPSSGPLDNPMPCRRQVLISIFIVSNESAISFIADESDAKYAI